MNNPDSSWEIETLIRKALRRVKERFLSYILAYIIMYAIVFSVTFILFVIGVFSAGAFISKTSILTGILFSILAVLGVISFMYVLALTQLAIVKVLIQKKKRSILQTYAAVKDDVWGYVWLSIAILIFTIGLIPFGLFSIGVIFILWSLWGCFVPFVYLMQKKSGLDNLWVSYSMFNQKFWAIFARIVVIYVGFMLVAILLGSTENEVLSVVQFIISLLFGPFAVSYLFEMYSLLKVPKKVERPKIWVGLSVVGYILILLFVFTAGDAIKNNLNNFDEFYQRQDDFNEKYFDNLKDFEEFEEFENISPEDIDPSSGNV